MVDPARDACRRVRKVERVIRVLDHQPEQPGFFLDLRDVLTAFAPDGHAWRWAIRNEPELSALPRWDLNLPFINGRSRTRRADSS